MQDAWRAYLELAMGLTTGVIIDPDGGGCPTITCAPAVWMSRNRRSSGLDRMIAEVASAS